MHIKSPTSDKSLGLLYVRCVHHTPHASLGILPFVCIHMIRQQPMIFPRLHQVLKRRWRSTAQKIRTRSALSMPTMPHRYKPSTRKVPQNCSTKYTVSEMSRKKYATHSDSSLGHQLSGDDKSHLYMRYSSSISDATTCSHAAQVNIANKKLLHMDHLVGLCTNTSARAAQVRRTRRTH